MKVIHTSYYGRDFLWKEQFYIQLLSALYAKKHYGNIHLYTSKAIQKQFEKVGSPYTSINTELFKIGDNKTYSIPKLKVYKEQTEPFLHLDGDSILFRKFNFEETTSPVTFSHPDMEGFRDLRGSTVSEFLPKFISNLKENINNKDYNFISEVYIDLFLKLHSQQDKKVLEFFNFSFIPNMAVVKVDEVKPFKNAVNYALEHYKGNKQEIDSSKFGAHYIEQLLVHQHLTAYSEKYRIACLDEKQFMVKTAPLTLEGSQSSSIEEIKWPFIFNTNYKCKCCDNQSTTKHSLNYMQSLTNYLSYDFGGYTHFSYLQWNQFFQTMIIAHIVDNFGEEVMLKAHKFFREEYKQRGLPAFSEGELHYELLRDTGLFTKN